MWNARTGGLDAWLGAVRNINAGQAPLLTWLGQIFVPVRFVFGDVEPAMVMLNVFVTALTLGVVYSISRRLHADAVGCLAAVLLCGGSGLMFAMSTTYMTEALHALASALMAAVALHVERRTLLKNVALFAATASLSFLVKSSSIIFVAPMLVYMMVAAVTVRGRRSLAEKADLPIALGSVAVTAITIWWYYANWGKVVMHFVGATTSTRWGRSGQVIEKLEFWSGHFLKALSSYPVIMMPFFAVVAIGLCFSVARLARKSSLGLILGTLIENGTLYVLTLAGMVVAIILAFSFQVNEDIRFLAPVIPAAAVLVGWSISTLPWEAARRSAVAILALNAGVTHAYAFGVKPPFVAAPVWPFPVYDSDSDKVVLLEAIQETCITSKRDQPTINFIGASYPALNANSINYYARKLTLSGAGPCIFHHFSIETDPRRAVEYMESVKPAYVVAVDPTVEPPPGFENTIARPFAALMASSQTYQPVPNPPRGMQIYRRLGS